MPHLFDELRLRGVVLANRIAVSPMCEYSCADGLANEGRCVDPGSRAARIQLAAGRKGTA
jgi:2,4-dienoyl-CoA reductase-like NADH-dependent reductase (Old Yellow Enzyme family)